jgi:hypothetical protein
MKEFCFDLQLYAHDLINQCLAEKGEYMLTFQQIRKKAYTHAKDPKWGDESYIDKEFEKLDGLESEYQKLKDLIKRVIEIGLEHEDYCGIDHPCEAEYWLKDAGEILK